MKILALDIGKFNTMCCLYDTTTRQSEFCVAETTSTSLRKIFTDRFAKAELVVMEACGPAGWISDLCSELKLDKLVCSTNEEAWKWTNVKRKTDRDDALKQAIMASTGSLKPVHIPSPDQRQFRSLVKYRKTLDQRINRVKNTIRSIFVNQGITIGKGFKAWTLDGLEHIKSFKRPITECASSEFWRGQLDCELTQLEYLSRDLAEVEVRLEELAAKDTRIQRVMSIPGVGRKTAEAIVASIDDPYRFKDSRQVSAYFGLVPRQFQSGETNRYGRITKRGSATVRSILVECAWCALRYNDWAKVVYDRISGEQKTRRKKAAVALARKIAVVAWALLRDETTWDMTTMSKKSEAFDRKKSPRPSAKKGTKRQMKDIKKDSQGSIKDKSAKRTQSRKTKIASH